MKLELRNIKVNEAFSEETTQFIADIFVDGKKVGYAKNDGRGGCTNYNAYPTKRVQLIAAEAYCLLLPAKEYPMGNKTLTIKSNLENWIDDQVEEFLKAKAKADFQKKIKRACETAIVWGLPDSENVSALGFKPKQKLTELMKTSNGKEAVMGLVVKVRGRLKKGEVIFNTNVPHSL